MQLETPIEPEISLSMWMTPESLKDVSTYLTPVLDEPTEQAMECLSELIMFIPPDALFATTNYLPQNAKSKIQLLLSPTTSPINSPVEASKDLHTPPHIYIKPRRGVQAKTPVETTISLPGWITLESFKKVSANHLAPITDELPDQAVESIKRLLVSIPGKDIGLCRKSNAFRFSDRSAHRGYAK